MMNAQALRDAIDRALPEIYSYGRPNREVWALIIEAAEAHLATLPKTKEPVPFLGTDEAHAAILAELKTTNRTLTFIVDRLGGLLHK